MHVGASCTSAKYITFHHDVPFPRAVNVFDCTREK